MTAEELASIAKALAHPARVRIVELLACETECRGQEIFSELPLAQSTISEHLRVLKDAGLVTSHAVGTAMVYCLDAERLARFSHHLAEIAERDACAAALRSGS
jgi:ArsR family transcriptional regulator